jgi:hypothetical protein
VQEPIRDDESREVSFGPDRLSAALRGELRTLVERMIREELVEALGVTFHIILKPGCRFLSGREARTYRSAA